MPTMRRLMFVLTIAVYAPVVFAQTPDCGPAPGTVTYTDSFQLGVYLMTQNDTSTGAGGSGKAIIDEIPTMFGFNYDANSHSLDIKNTTLQQAHTYVQQESKYQSAALVAQCRYGLCKLPNTPSSDLAVVALRDVCQTALLGSLPGGWVLGLSPLRIDPDIIPIVFDDKTTVRVNATIYNDGEAVVLAMPYPEDYVKVAIPASGPIRVPAHGSKEVSFLLKKPSQGKVEQSLNFISTRTNNVKTTATFRLVSNSQYFQPPVSIGCGTVEPHLSYSVTADAGWTKGGTLDDAISLSATDSAKNAGDGYPYNGQGEADVQVHATCIPVTPGDSNGAYTQVNIKTSTHAQGGCCGGLQPGGQAYSQPEWQSTLFVPGSASDQWNFKVTLNTQISTDPADFGARPNGQCKFSIDGTGNILDQTVAQSVFTATLTPGNHALHYQCESFGLNVRGAGAVISRSVTATQSLYLQVSKITGPKKP
ncbi:MAG TPA: hypothetical protein VFK06_17755 [Candidatus Angelobacter sp.]|nr:hypothetical protein [Candidatus Angelobacter sp.]